MLSACIVSVLTGGVRLPGKRLLNDIGLQRLGEGAALYVLQSYIGGRSCHHLIRHLHHDALIIFTDSECLAALARVYSSLIYLQNCHCIPSLRLCEEALHLGL